MNTHIPLSPYPPFSHIPDPKDQRIKQLEQENQKLQDTLEKLTQKLLNDTTTTPPPTPQKKLTVITKPNQATILTTKRVRP